MIPLLTPATHSSLPPGTRTNINTPPLSLQGLDPNVMAGSGGAPLMIAARLGALDAVELLLAAGATPDAQAAPSEPFMAEVSIASS